MTFKNQQQRAIAEFDEKFPSHISMNHGLRNFISSLLTRTRRDVLEEVEARMPEEREVRLASECGDCSNIPPVYCRHAQGWNDYKDFSLTTLRAMQEENN